MEVLEVEVAPEEAAVLIPTSREGQTSSRGAKGASSLLPRNGEDDGRGRYHLPQPRNIPKRTNRLGGTNGAMVCQRRLETAVSVVDEDDCSLPYLRLEKKFLYQFLCRTL